MKKTVSLFLCVLLLCAMLPSTSLAQGEAASQPPLTPVDQLVDDKGNVVFNDPIVESAIREALGIPEGPISQKQLGLLGAKQEELFIVSQTETTADLSILQLCTNLKSLHLENVTPVNLSAVTSLKSLNFFFANNIKITDLSFLVGITGLSDVLIDECPGIDLSAVANMPSLIGLSIGMYVPDITPLYTCKKLASVAVTKLTNRQVNKLLDRIGTQLSGLGLDDCDINDETLVRISKMPLRYFELMYPMLETCNIHSIAPVWNMKTLTDLKFYKMQIDSLDGIERLTNLNVFWLGKTFGLSDYQPLFHMTNLRSLKLDSIKTPDLQGIQNMTNLEDLTLDTLRTTVDLTPVFALSKLKHLSLNNLKVTSIDGIEGLASLTDLSLYQIQGVEDYSPLSGLKKLEAVSTDIPDKLPADLPIQ